MKEKKYKSYSRKEDALFAKMKSKRLQRWYNNRLSKMDSKEDVWLIVFTRPSREKTEWKTKFWIWDSQSDKILGENILYGYYLPETTFKKYIFGCSPIECYIQKEFGFVVFRHARFKALLIFDMKGNLLAQTEKVEERLDEKDIVFSKFLSENILFSKAGKTLNLFYLDQKNGLEPKRMPLLWQSNVVPKGLDIKVILSTSYCIVSGHDPIPSEHGETGCDTIWLYSARGLVATDRGFQFQMKFSFHFTVCDLEAQETNEELLISFHDYHGLQEKRMEIKIPRTMY